VGWAAKRRTAAAPLRKDVDGSHSMRPLCAGEWTYSLGVSITHQNRASLKRRGERTCLYRVKSEWHSSLR
jgi:hypothetical protein